MASKRQFFVGGNFKMNGTSKSTKDIIEGLNNASLDSNTEVVISPPTLFLLLAREHLKGQIEIAAQNVYDQGPYGAYTGEVSAQQLFENGITWTLTGHSERRTHMSEDDDFVASKTAVALKSKLSVILCVGETLEEREKNKTIEVVERQLNAVKSALEKADQSGAWEDGKIVIAYEPVWAIGTGKVATTAQAQEVHDKIRGWLGANISSRTADITRIIYGGSVNEKNCGELAGQKDVDGFLVGGASLKPAFIDIINARQSKQT